MRNIGRRSIGLILLVVASTVVQRPAGAFEVSGGVSVGGIFAGTVPRLALSPHAGIGWRLESGFVFELHDVLSILPPIGGRGAGVYNQTSATVGYASLNANFSVGPSLSVYFMPACRHTLCSQVVGVAPGAHAQANLYFAGPFGASVQASVDWIGGRSLVLPGGAAAMVVAGPVLRW
jgi:hypothetical protein